MKNTFGNTNTELVALAERATGMRYDSPDAKAILNEADWTSHWPVVDADSLLTGDVVETDDCDDYWNVGDEAMIAEDDLHPGQRGQDGYANLSN